MFKSNRRIEKVVDRKKHSTTETVYSKFQKGSIFHKETKVKKIGSFKLDFVTDVL